MSKASNPFRNIANPTCSSNLEWTVNVYDAAGRVKEIITPDGAKVQTAFLLATTGTNIGTVVTVTDQAGKQRRSITNGLGQLKRVDEPTTAGLGTIASPNQATYYDYDDLNNLITVKQGGTLSNPEQTRTFAYDSLSRLKQAVNPESGTINYLYDNNGNLTSKTDARQITTSYAYDNLNRVITRSYNDLITPNVTYYYDNLPNAKGQLIKVASSVSETRYTSFDNFGRLSTHEQRTTPGQLAGTETPYQTAYSYNLSGGLVEQTYPSGRVVKNVLDNDGQLAMVQSKKTANAGYFNYAKNFTYTAHGAVKSMQLGNGKWESTTFNSRLQPTQIALGTVQGGVDKLKLNYTYGTTNNNGNVLSQTITVPTTGNTTGFTAIQTYNYDELNRLKSANETISGNQTWKQTFNYDRYGNRTFDTNNTTTLGSCPANQCNPTINIANNRFNNGQGYTYDLAGNIITDAEGKSFTFDGENKQTSVKDANNSTIGEYFYDGEGKRVKKFIYNTQETTVFVYNAVGQLVAEYSTQTNSNPQVSYLTSDHLGSPRILTDANGNTISRRDFMPFGEEIYTSHRTSGLDYKADNVKQGFTGYEKDGETGLNFAKNRYFDSGYGRFSTPDPALESAEITTPQSWNRYAYVQNNPLAYTDPLGLWRVGFVTLANGKKAYAFIKSKDDDDAESLLEQLGFDPKDKDDKTGQSILKAISDSILTKGDDAIAQLSSIGEKLEGGDFAKYGNFLSIVEEKMLAQLKHKNEGKKGGPEDDNYYDCSLTTCKLALPEKMKGKNKNNFDVNAADELLTNFSNASSISKKSLRLLDVVKYGSEGKSHFGAALFKDDDKNFQVFSRLGANGPFDVHPINAKEVKKEYGNVSGTFRPRN